MRRTWIKIYCDGWLRGSIRKERADIRSVFADLVVLAGDSAFGEFGIIQLADGIGFTDEVIAGILNITLNLWIKAKDRLSNHPDRDENRIEIIKVNTGFIIKIINWKEYQSEYSRQKKYRKLQKKLHPELQKKLQGDIDIERDIDIEKEKEGEIINKSDFYVSLSEEEVKILKLLREVRNFPRDDENTIAYLRDLKEEFPDVDAIESIKEKIAWWIKKPLSSRSNPYLQLRNWFRTAQGWINDAKREHAVGSPIRYTDEEKKQIEIFKKEYKQKFARFMKEKGYKSEKEIPFNEIPEPESDYVIRKMNEFRKERRQ